MGYTISNLHNFNNIDSERYSNFIGIKAPNAVTTSTTFRLPDGDGSAGQFLKTDGSGQISFANASSSLGSSLSLVNVGSAWDISVDSNNNLVFSYGGTAKAKIATDGHITSINDLTAFGTV